MGREPIHEVIIVGAGIAGASLAYFLVERGVSDVLLLEREEQPGYHTTGRSAAVLAEYNPVKAVRQLCSLGTAFLRTPPEGLSETPIFDNAGLVILAHAEAWPALRALPEALAVEGIETAPLSARALRERFGALFGRPQHVAGGLLFPADGHLDVHALHQGYLGHARRAGVDLRCRTEVTGLLVERGRCVGVQTPGGPLRARSVVNAAGAWAGELGRAAGAAPIEIRPLHRTVITFAAPEVVSGPARSWPFFRHDSSYLYFKPESNGVLLASPMDETPSAPCDARPTEEGVALCIDRLSAIAPVLVPGAIRHKWAGLRTFGPDRVPLVGPDPLLPGFFWLAGQGGVGIETSPALGAIATDLLLDGRTERFDASLMAPARFS